jgi:sirohydrochlorin cobaltochelatase
MVTSLGMAADALEVRIKTLLPEVYQDTYEDLQPVPMRSAGLTYAPDGRVAWDEMWGSFCDLAMAGGPPHKGALLGPGLEADIDADFDRYDEAAEEICRGIRLVTGLRAYVSPDPGWVRVSCPGDAMAGWLLRAITMENVAARRQGAMLDLPAAPHFRLDKEIKNVITVTAKTCHYWVGHIPHVQQQAIADLFLTLERESPLLEPAFDLEERADRSAVVLAEALQRETGLRRAGAHYAGWVGVECDSVRAAVWMMRALVASNVLARRESTVLYLPVNPSVDPGGHRVVAAVQRVCRLAPAQHLGRAV